MKNDFIQKEEKRMLFKISNLYYVLSKTISVLYQKDTQFTKSLSEWAKQQKLNPDLVKWGQSVEERVESIYRRSGLVSNFDGKGSKLMAHSTIDLLQGAKSR